MSANGNGNGNGNGKSKGRKYEPLGVAEFNKAVDSPAGTDPMPVESHEFPMRYPHLINRAVVELMSLAYSRTIRKGYRQPVLVDGGGNLFTIERIIADRGWSLDWGQRVLNLAIESGLLRRGTGKKDDYPPEAIILMGRVKPIENQQDTSTNELVDSECTLRKLLSATEFAQFEKLPEERRKAILEEGKVEAEIDRRTVRDAIFRARESNRERHHIRLSRWGIAPDPPAKKRRLEEPIVELTIKLPANGNLNGNSYEDRSVHSGANSPEPAGVHVPVYTGFGSDASLLTLPKGSYPKEDLIRMSSAEASDSAALQTASTSSSSPCSDGQQKPGNTQAAHAPEVPERPIEHAQRAVIDRLPDEIEWLAQQCGFEPDVARQIIEGVRKKDPTIKLSVIRELINSKHRQHEAGIQAGRITNFIGILVRGLPHMVHAPERRRAEQIAEKRAFAEAASLREEIANCLRILEHRFDGSVDDSDVKYAVVRLRELGIEYGAPDSHTRAAAGGAD